MQGIWHKDYWERGLIMAHIANRHESVLKDRDKLQRLAVQ